jgi:hypothetical protein
MQQNYSIYSGESNNTTKMLSAGRMSYCLIFIILLETIYFYEPLCSWIIEEIHIKITLALNVRIRYRFML